LQDKIKVVIENQSGALTLFSKGNNGYAIAFEITIVISTNTRLGLISFEVAICNLKEPYLKFLPL
jgi:hypothetical protein